eukprot:4636676-Amphidinium_carterae.1
MGTGRHDKDRAKAPQYSCKELARYTGPCVHHVTAATRVARYFETSHGAEVYATRATGTLENYERLWRITTQTVIALSPATYFTQQLSNSYHDMGLVPSALPLPQGEGQVRYVTLACWHCAYNEQCKSSE